MPDALIIEQYKGLPVHFMGDGWFNATLTAKRYGKRIDHWLENDETAEYVQTLH